jgi:hypothetical protein
MKKTLIVAITLLIAFAFTACEDPIKTQEEKLAQKKGWTLYTATSNPAYTNYAGVTSENLFVSFFYPCELDDILSFNENKSSIMNFGKLICEDQQGKDVSLGNWKFKSEKVLEFHLPYFFDADDNFALLEGSVITLDENTFQVRVPVTFVDDPAKGNATNVANVVKNTRGMKAAKGDAEFDFTLTYKIAK